MYDGVTFEAMRIVEVAAVVFHYVLATEMPLAFFGTILWRAGFPGSLYLSVMSVT